MNVIDDDIPEEQEYFHVALRHPKGGAEIGFGGQVTVVVPANDDAHGVIGFSEVITSIGRFVKAIIVMRPTFICLFVVSFFNGSC